MANVQIKRWREIFEPNAAMLRFELAGEGYRVFQWSGLPDTIQVLHRHGEDQSHWVISGSLEITIKDESYVLEAGDRDFMPAEIWHSTRVIGEETVVYLVGEKI